MQLFHNKNTALLFHLLCPKPVLILNFEVIHSSNTNPTTFAIFQFQYKSNNICYSRI